MGTARCSALGPTSHDQRTPICKVAVGATEGLSVMGTRQLLHDSSASGVSGRLRTSSRM